MYKINFIGHVEEDILEIAKDNVLWWDEARFSSSSASKSFVVHDNKRSAPNFPYLSASCVGHPDESSPS